MIRFKKWTILKLTLLALVAVGCGTPTPTEAPAPTTEIQPIVVPAEGAVVALPLHVLARVGEPGHQVRATLRWDDGTELSGTFTTLAHPEGGGLLVDSLDWTTEGPPPEPETQSATLILSDPASEILAERDVTVLDTDDADVQLIDLYWTLGENLESEQRPVVATDNLAATALEELLWGPPPRNLAGFATALPTPQEVIDYPGRQPDWGVRVILRSLTIEGGVATADFSQEMQAYGGGSMRVQTIREQITRTLMQFPDVNEVRIAVEGETEGVLQP